MVFNTNVDSIVKSLNKTVSKLHAHAKKQDAELMKNANKITVLSDKCDYCRNEVAKALCIAEKIGKLVD